MRDVRTLAGPRVLLRVATVLCLLLAAVVLAADSAEYRPPSRAGLRALATNVLPLLVVGLVCLRAIDGGREWRAAAAAGSLGLLVTGVEMLARGGPPLAWMLAAVALLLLAGLVPLLRRHPSPGR